MMSQNHVLQKSESPAPTGLREHHQPTNLSSSRNSLRESGEGIFMHRSKGNARPTVVGDRRNTSSRVSTREFSDWIAEQARPYSEKELADITGLGIKGAQNLRAGKSGCIGSTLATWCKNDPIFAAAYCEYVGFIPPGHAEFAGRMNQAIQASQRLHMGGDAQ